MPEGKTGIICDPRNIDGQWLVCFDQYGALPNIATIPVDEEDLEMVAEYPVVQTGRRVLLLFDCEEYARHGAQKGMYGYVCAPSDKADYWLVKFDLPNGTESTVSDYEDHMVIENPT